MGCIPSKLAENKSLPLEVAENKLRPAGPGYDDFSILASETPFAANEVETLHELYRKLSTSIVKDGFIQKEELHFALFRNINRRNLFVDRVFDLFDVNKNGHIDFGEFIRSLSIFHPKTSEAVKVKYAFKLYDLRHTGYIEHEEECNESTSICVNLGKLNVLNSWKVYSPPLQLKEMVFAMLNESDLALSDDVVETIVDKTFVEADSKGDGRIDMEEWEEYVGKNPSVLKNMTLPYLLDISEAFPSFVVNGETEESHL